MCVFCEGKVLVIDFMLVEWFGDVVLVEVCLGIGCIY